MNSTTPYVGKYLRSVGLKVKRDGDLYYAGLAQERDLIVRWKDGVLSIAVAMPVEADEMEAAATVAKATMIGTTGLKIYFVSDAGEPDMWFELETGCKTRAQFEELFTPNFEKLFQIVRKYLSLRYEIKKAMSRRTLAWA